MREVWVNEPRAGRMGRQSTPWQASRAAAARATKHSRRIAFYRLLRFGRHGLSDCAPGAYQSPRARGSRPEDGWSGGAIEAIEMGRGPTLLYIHGILSCAAEIVPIMGHLANDFRVVAIDQPGHGGSDPYDYQHADVHEAAGQWLTAVVEDLGVATPNLLSNSLGNLIAARFLAIQPAGRAVCMGARRRRLEGAPVRPVRPLLNSRHRTRGVRGRPRPPQWSVVARVLASRTGRHGCRPQR